MLLRKFKSILFFILIQTLNVTCAGIIRSGNPEFRLGDACMLSDGSKGYCEVLTQCSYAMDEIKNNSDASLEFCVYDVKKPIVCCLNCTAVEKDAYSYAYNYHRENIPEACIKKYLIKVPCNELSDNFENLDDRIMCEVDDFEDNAISPVVAGGVAAKIGQFPHMALIGYGDDKDSADWMCGGSVINKHYILTAAHCISAPQLGEIKFAALGILKRTDDRKMWQIYDIDEIIGYPEYKPPSKYHDIALLRTAAMIIYNNYVYPACLHRGADTPDEGLATGWGATGHRERVAEVLQVVKVKKFSDEECAKEYPQHRHLKHGYDKKTQLCYGDEDNINDTCEGDSGGPLQTTPDPRNRGRCMYIVFGVTSYGRSCGYAGSTGMYTRVSAYIGWIENVAGEIQ